MMVLSMNISLNVSFPSTNAYCSSAIFGLIFCKRNIVVQKASSFQCMNSNFRWTLDQYLQMLEEGRHQALPTLTVLIHPVTRRPHASLLRHLSLPVEAQASRGRPRNKQDPLRPIPNTWWSVALSLRAHPLVTLGPLPHMVIQWLAWWGSPPLPHSKALSQRARLWRCCRMEALVCQWIQERGVSPTPRCTTALAGNTVTLSSSSSSKQRCTTSNNSSSSSREALSTVRGGCTPSTPVSRIHPTAQSPLSWVTTSLPSRCPVVARRGTGRKVCLHVEGHVTACIPVQARHTLLAQVSVSPSQVWTPAWCRWGVRAWSTWGARAGRISHRQQDGLKVSLLFLPAKWPDPFKL